MAGRQLGKDRCFVSASIVIHEDENSQSGPGRCQEEINQFRPIPTIIIKRFSRSQKMKV